jgi:hypothetical protein
MLFLFSIKFLTNNNPKFSFLNIIGRHYLNSLLKRTILHKFEREISLNNPIA